MTWSLQPVIPTELYNWGTTEPSKLTVFCDLDGPLVDVSHRYYQTYRRALQQTRSTFFGEQSKTPLAPLNRSQFWAMKQERVPDPEIALRSGLQGVQIDFFLRTVKTIVNQPDLLQLDRAQLGAGYALAQLYRLGVKLAVVTLRHQEQAVQVLKQHELAHWLSNIRGTHVETIAYDNYVDCKQALLADVMRQPPFVASQQFVMIGDTEADVLAAKALGISTIALTCGMRSRAYLERLRPTCICPSLLAAVQSLVESLVRRPVV